MDAQIFGRVGKRLLQFLGQSQERKTWNSADLEKLVRPLIQWLVSSVPRQLSPKLDQQVVHVFTDGACKEQEMGLCW
jgi:hypothetical protein